MIRTIALVLLAFVVVPCAFGATPSGSNAPYAIQTDVLDAGGSAASNGVYSQIGSFGGIEGLVGTTPLSMGHGYIAQIQSAEMLPSPSLNVTNQVLAYSPSSQMLPLSATLVPTTGTVNEGTVSFQLTLNGTVVAVSSALSVSNNMANGSLTVPAGQAPNTYSINASFSGGPTYFGSMGAGTLTLNKATATLSFNNLTFVFTGNSNVVTATTTPSNLAYTVTYNGMTYPQGQGPVGSAAQATNYTVVATIQDANYMGTATGQMTINASGGGTTGGPVATTTSSAPAMVTRSPSAQNVNLTATVTPVGGNGAVNEGTVTFQITDSNNSPVNGPVTSSTVSGGNVSVSYPLPGALPIGTYTITATFGPSPNFLASSDNTHLLTVMKSLNGSSPFNVAITAIDRNPALTGVQINITATAQTLFGQPLTFIWNLYDSNGIAMQPPLRTSPPQALTGITATDTLPTTFTTEGNYIVGVIVDDGYNPDSAAGVNILAQRLAPNPQGIGANIANTQAGGISSDPNPSAAVQIAVAESTAGVIDVNIQPQQSSILPRTIDNSGDFGHVSGRNDSNGNFLNTAFKFTEAQIIVLQVFPGTTGVMPLAQRMVAISQQEVMMESNVVPPADGGAMTVSNVKAMFTFSSKKHTDTLTLKVAFKLPGGLNLADGSTDIYFGLGNAILKFNMQKGKAKTIPLETGNVSPVAMTKATLALSPAVKGVTTQGTAVKASISLTSSDLTTMGLGYLGVTDPPKSTSIPVECLMLVGGVPYRQVITATYSDKNHKGVLTKK